MVDDKNNQPLGGNEQPRFSGSGTFMRLPSTENIESLDNLNFSKSELQEINKKAKEGNINKWARSSSY